MDRDCLSIAIVEALKLIQSINNFEPAAKASDPLLSYLYTPHKNLEKYLEKLEDKLSISKLPKEKRPINHHTEIGQILEQIAYMCFTSISGISSVKSFQSPGPQYDLLVTGDSMEWMTMCKSLYISYEKRDILIEVKATKTKIDDKIFSRLCSLLQLNLFSTSQLGVFFTLEGATGFPKRQTISRQRKISDSRLRQLLFHSLTNKFIIVFDKHDIESLIHPGSLIKILINKIRDIENQAGIYIPQQIDEPIHKDLPQHLKNL